MLGNEPDAEDVLQNTFLKAFQHIDDFEGRSSLSTWLYRIASNEALMLLRKRHPETTFTDAIPEEDDNRISDPVEFTDWCCLPEEEFLSTESQAPWIAPSSTSRRLCGLFSSCGISRTCPSMRPARPSV